MYYGDGLIVTRDATVTRSANTNTYTINDAWAATSAATGGSTISNATGRNGGSGVILDAWITCSTSPATALQGEIWLFDQAVTAVADEDPFTITDAENRTCIGVIPFTLAATGGGNASAHVTNLNYGFTCVNSADIRFLVKVKNAYVAGSADVLGVRLKIRQSVV